MGLMTTYVAKPRQPINKTGMILVIHLVTARVLSEDMPPVGHRHGARKA